MKIRLFMMAALLFGWTPVLLAQTLGEFSPKEQRGSYGPRKFSSRDIYIANFSVNFQLYNLKTARTKGSFSGRMLSGKTKAALAIGLDIPAATLQQITNEAYMQFVADLKAKGFNVLNGDVAAKTRFYEGYQRFEGMEMSLSEAPGMVTVYPEQAVFFVKGFNQSGKKKIGGLLGTIGIADRNDEIARYPKLSDELNNATIVNADLYVLFVDVKKPYQGNGASIVANTDLRLDANGTVVSRVANKGLSTKMGLTGNTKEKSVQTISSVDFISGRNSIGGSPLGTYKGVLKKDLAINGVIGKEKVQSYARTQHDFIGTETAFGKVYRADDISVENTALIRADAGKYQRGVTEALKQFLTHHVDAFTHKFF